STRPAGTSSGWAPLRSVSERTRRSEPARSPPRVVTPVTDGRRQRRFVVANIMGDGSRRPPMMGSTESAGGAAGDEGLVARLEEIERSLSRYGCFDLVEEDVQWLIARLREQLARRTPSR